MVQDALITDAIGGMALLIRKVRCFHDVLQHHAKDRGGKAVGARQGSLVGDEEHGKTDIYPMDLGSGHGGWQ